MIVGLLIVAAALAAFLLFVASKPNRFELKRSIVIAAPAAKIRPHVEDFHLWGGWSPWEKIDPTMQRSFSGADKGVGAVYDWTGDGKAGAGRMTITAATPEATLIALDFFKPFKASNITEFSYTPEGDGVLVGWTMSGPQPFIGKLMHAVFNMDKLVGGDFEKGLKALKTVAEA